jgi:hypothetical protein
LGGSDGGASGHVAFLSGGIAEKGLVDLRALTSTGSDLFKNLKSVSEFFINLPQTMQYRRDIQSDREDIG